MGKKMFQGCNMKIYILLFLSATVNLFSQDFITGMSFGSSDYDYYFGENILTIDKYNYETRKLETEKYPYALITENKIPYMVLDGKNIEEFLKLKEKKFEKFLALSGKDILLLFTSDESRPLHGGLFVMKPSVLFNNYEIKSSSSYSDNQFSFPAENLSNLNLFHPWVEGVPGYGIGERISFTAEEIKPIVGFYFSNGFVSFEKPYLYTQNARVKKIKVTNENKDFNFVYDIDDTPNLQYFEVKRNTQDLIIEILDVYPGTKWEDTAINFILLDTRDFFGYSSDSDNEK